MGILMFLQSRSYVENMYGGIENFNYDDNYKYGHLKNYDL